MDDFSLDSAALCEVLRRMATSLPAHSEEVRLLDAAIGDGDLGVTAELMSQAMRELADSTEETDTGKLLAQCGMAVNRANPSTFGTIMASGFMGAGKAVAGKTTLDLADLVTAGEAALLAMKNRGKAEEGDKTVLDALAPAVAALAAENEKGGDSRSAIQAAARACERGMKATVAMTAKHGKQRVFAEKSVGVQDGGATVLHYMVEAFADFVEESPR